MAYLKEGEKAPGFKAKNQNGQDVNLSDYKGKKVVLYFYPKDDTPGCTAEACNLRDNHSELVKRGFIVLGVSPDNEKSHTKFSTKYNLPFDLLTDTDTSIMKAYGAWGTKKMYGREYEGVLRTTYVINEEGNIEKVITKVDTKDSTAQILQELEIS
jgi:peroxiredoxin Q/BCP